VRQRVSVLPESSERRLFALHPDGFREHVLPECLRCACLMESSSHHPARRTGSSIHPSGSASRISVIEQAKPSFFERMIKVANTGY
jgi:hypothetical protein